MISCFWLDLNRGDFNGDGEKSPEDLRCFESGLWVAFVSEMW